MDVSSTSRTFSIHIVSIHKMQVMLKGLERILCRVVFLSMPRARFKYNLEKKKSTALFYSFAITNECIHLIRVMSH